MSRATNSERSPLLRIQSRQSDAPSFAVADVAPSAFQVTGICLALVVAQQVAVLLSTLAAGSLSHAAVCRRLLGEDVADPTNDERCRHTEVVSRLASLSLVEGILATAAGVLAPIPIAVAADRFGRRPFLVLPLVGSALNIVSRVFIYKFPHVFPPKLIWLSAAIELFSGGGGAFLAIIYTIITDVTYKAQRSTSFFYLAAATILSSQIGLTLWNFLTDNFGPWTALLTALGALIFGILCAFCIPETIHLNKTSSNEQAVEDEPAAQTALQRIRTAIPASYNRTIASMAAIFCRSTRLAVLMLTKFVTALSAISLSLASLYINYRYKLPLDKAASLQRKQIISYFLVNALLLPLAAHFLLSFNFSALRKDVFFVRWGLLAATVALFGIGLAPNTGFLLAALLLYTLDAAFAGALNGLLSQLTGEDHMAVMFATTRVLSTLGSVLGLPLFNALFKFGINHGKHWMGLPYLVLGGVFALTTAVVFLVSSAPAEQEADYDEQD
ncbi:hypothetical protein PWT90_07775 [Aphanocladium album]|nr:hypothetical protein PWT90_07775 [Aphanocladium album]